MYPTGPYLILVTERKSVGAIAGKHIWNVVKTEVVSYTRSLTHLTETQVDST